MNDNEPELSEGQKVIDKETDRRNRENETGEAQKSVREQAGQAIERSDTSVADEADQPIVATSGDAPSDYLTKGEEEETDFAEQGQGAPEPAGRSDIEHPTPGTPDAVLDEGSSAKP